MKKIAVVTASRADYGIYLPVIKAIKDHPDLKVRLCAVGDPDYLDFPLPCEFKRGEEDCVVVLGDTMPMLYATIEAIENNIPVIHIHGGDKTGSIDDKIRPAISAFADFHFPALPEHADRLKQVGIPNDRIKVIGPLGIYAMKDAEFIPEKELRARLNLSDKPIIIVIQHPVHGESKQAGRQIRETLDAVLSFTDIQPVVFYPNSEVGSEDMIQVIKEYLFKTFPNLPYLTFISLLKYASLIVGNSSCGLVEAPLFGVPCVSIGTRQGERKGGLSLTVNYLRAQIENAITYFLSKQKWEGFNPYSIDVDGAEIIANTLAEL